MEDFQIVVSQQTPKGWIVVFGDPNSGDTVNHLLKQTTTSFGSNDSLILFFKDKNHDEQSKANIQKMYTLGRPFSQFARFWAIPNTYQTKETKFGLSKSYSLVPTAEAAAPKAELPLP